MMPGCELNFAAHSPMEIRRLIVKHFRGIESLEWDPTSRLTCIVGPGDVGKSSILDAIEAVLSPRWVTFSDVDFHNCDLTKSIEIQVTVGGLPADALRESRFGFHLRGWSSGGEVHDEPQNGDEEVVTVRLIVDSSLDPVWELITDRSEPRTLSPKDRAAFGVVRLGADVERHLTWGHGSALARLSSDKDKASPVLAKAYRDARELLSAEDLPWLKRVAESVKEISKSLGAYAADDYTVGLDTQRAAMSLGTIALHAGKIPVRLAGLGTRRLVALAIQRMSIPEGAIILIDELEHGLEPHRIRHTLKVLRNAVQRPPGDQGVGQVFLTTHSAISIVELSHEQLSIGRKTGNVLHLQRASKDLQATIRRAPEAFLAHRVIVCEGKTEEGMVRTLKTTWAAAHGDEPLEYRGGCVLDGKGTGGSQSALELGRLGYQVAFFRDSDRPIEDAVKDEIAKLTNIKTIEWKDGFATEDRVFEDFSPVGVQQLLEIAYSEHGEESILSALQTALSLPAKPPKQFSDWSSLGKDAPELRKGLAKASKSKSRPWFKRIDLGEELGRAVADEIARGPETSLAKTLNEIEAWIYA